MIAARVWPAVDVLADAIRHRAPTEKPLLTTPSRQAGEQEAVRCARGRMKAQARHVPQPCLVLALKPELHLFELLALLLDRSQPLLSPGLVGGCVHRVRLRAAVRGFGFSNR
jgi:hypothetical protein